MLLAGDRGAALSAIKDMVKTGEGPGAVVMNLMARLLHDAGNLQEAVNAYLKALEVYEVYGMRKRHVCTLRYSSSFS